MMHNDPLRMRVEYYDISLAAKHPQMSLANPQLCMQCHAVDINDLNQGLRLPFESPSTWTRFVNGVFNQCGNEIQYLRTLSDIAMTALQTNPQYRCLDKTGKNDPKDWGTFRGHQFSQLSDLDQNIADLNDREVAKRIRQTPEYERYKYAILGSIRCDLFRPEDWLPEAVIRRNNDMSSLDSRVRDSTDLTATYISILKEQKEKARLVSNYEHQATERLKKGELPEFEIETNSAHCVDKPLPTAAELKFDIDFLPENPIIAKYKIDSQLKGFRDSNVDYGFRYLFESRGIDTLPWQTAPAPSLFYRSHRFLVRHMLRLDPALQKLQAEIQAPEPLDPPKGREDICDKLKRLSKSAFNESDNLKKVPSNNLSRETH